MVPTFTSKMASPGRPGGCPPGLPQIRTCPTQAYGSSGRGLTTCTATRNSFGHRAAGLSVPTLSPSCGSAIQVPPSLHRVPAAAVPRLRHYYEALRLPTALPDALRRPSHAGDRPVRLCSLRSARRRPAAWSFAVRQPRAHLRIGNGRVSQVPGEPCCAYALLSDPGRTNAPGPKGAPARPPPGRRRRLPRGGVFRGSITRPWHWLSTLRRTDCSATTQDSLPAAGQALRGGIGYPQGSEKRFAEDVLHPRPPFPGFAWRNYHHPPPPRADHFPPAGKTWPVASIATL